MTEPLPVRERALDLGQASSGESSSSPELVDLSRVEWSQIPTPPGEHTSTSNSTTEPRSSPSTVLTPTEKLELANGTPKPLTDSDRVLQDGSLIRKSKRLARQQKKAAVKASKKPSHPRNTLLDLPYELVTSILHLLLPADLIRLSRVCRSLHSFITQESNTLARWVIKERYPVLEKCLRLPVLLAALGDEERTALQREERLRLLRKQAYSHIQSADPAVLCTCLTCVLRWNSLNLVLDFAHWQGHLNRGDPIPMIPRGQNPEWNQNLLAKHAAVVQRATTTPLLYACILQTHLASTVGSIRRHAQNKGNQRRRFRMNAEDERSGTDGFLSRSGPPTVDFPFHRDNYYMLESYLPNRGWNGEEARWMYMPASQHDTDVGMVVRFYRRRMEEEERERLEKERQRLEQEGTSDGVTENAERDE
ncbi:hypothetical protein DL546_004223 [Coniochaeta pulveracea]|uniref:F-box domain-containing protein n=1 Tax=Coniochaeta pulveracea TaxID=177199 RepID=A0A420Y0R4_9PEZI|nr:hypothetical protein DL546_004223 [Coniochaeta pulveracea]